jgi:WD40 repeat protein
MSTPRWAQIGLLLVLVAIYGAAPVVWLDELRTEQRRGACFSSDGQFLARATDRGCAIFDLTTGTATHLACSGQLAFSGDASLLACGTQTGLAVWDWRRGQRLFSWDNGNPRALLLVAVSTDGAHVAAADDSSLRVWEVRTAKLLVTIPLPYRHASLAFSPDGKLVALGGTETKAAGVRTHEVKLWTVAEGAVHAVLVGPEYCHVNAIAIAPDGKTLASALSINAVRLWDISERREIWKTSVPVSYGALAFSPDGKHLASAGLGGGVTVLDTLRPQERRDLRLPPGCIIDAVGPAPAPAQFLIAAGDQVYSVSPGDGEAIVVHRDLRSRLWLWVLLVVLGVWVVLWSVVAWTLRSGLPVPAALIVGDW